MEKKVKKNSLILFLSFITLLLFCKEKIVILEFKAMGEVSPALAKSITEILITSVADQGTYQVLERSQREKIFKEMSLTESDEFDDSIAIEIGKHAKAKLILIGSLSKLGSRYVINARGIDIETGNITFGKSVYAPSEDELFDKTIELSALISGSKETGSSTTSSTASSTTTSSNKEIYSADLTAVHKDFPEIDKFPLETYYENGKYMIERKKGKEWLYFFSKNLKIDYSKDFVISFRLFYSYGNFALLFGAAGEEEQASKHFFYLSDEWFDYGTYENHMEIPLISNRIPTNNITGSEIKLVKEKNKILIYVNGALTGKTVFKKTYGNFLQLFVEGRSKVGLEYFKVEYK